MCCNVVVRVYTLHKKYQINGVIYQSLHTTCDFLFRINDSLIRYTGFKIFLVSVLIFELCVLPGYFYIIINHEGKRHPKRIPNKTIFNFKSYEYYRFPTQSNYSFLYRGREEKFVFYKIMFVSEQLKHWLLITLYTSVG